MGNIKVRFILASEIKKSVDFIGDLYVIERAPFFKIRFNQKHKSKFTKKVFKRIKATTI